MSEHEIQHICQLVLQGGKLLIGRDHAGRQKLKIVRGPFGLLTERFQCTPQDIDAVRQRLSSLRKAATAA